MNTGLRFHVSTLMACAGREPKSSHMEIPYGKVRAREGGERERERERERAN
jgi:hypothetical protein